MLECSESSSVLSFGDLQYFAKFKNKVVFCDALSLSVQEGLCKVFNPTRVSYVPDASKQFNSLDLKTLAVGENLEHLSSDVVLKAVGFRVIATLLANEHEEYRTNGAFYIKSFSLTHQRVFLCTHQVDLSNLVIHHNGEVVSEPAEATLIVYETINSATSLSNWINLRQYDALFISVNELTSITDHSTKFEDLKCSTSKLKPFSGIKFHIDFLTSEHQEMILSHGGVFCSAEDEFGIAIVTGTDDIDTLLKLHTMERKGLVELVDQSWLIACCSSGCLVSLNSYKAQLEKLPDFYAMNPTGLPLFVHHSLTNDSETLRIADKLGVNIVDEIDEALGVIAAPFHGQLQVLVPARNQFCLGYMEDNGAHICPYYHKCYDLKQSAVTTLSALAIKGIKAAPDEKRFIEELFQHCRTNEEHPNRAIILWDGTTDAQNMRKLMQMESFKDTGTLVVGTNFIRDVLKEGENAMVESHIVSLTERAGNEHKRSLPPGSSSITSKRLHADIPQQSGPMRKQFASYLLQRLLASHNPLQLELGQMVIHQKSLMPSIITLISLDVTFDADIKLLGTGVVNEFSAFHARDVNSALVAGVYYDKDETDVHIWCRKLLDEMSVILETVGVYRVHAKLTELGYELLHVHSGVTSVYMRVEMCGAMENVSVSEEPFWAAKFWVPPEALSLFASTTLPCSELSARQLLIVCSESVCYCEKPMKLDGTVRMKYFHVEIDRDTQKTFNLVYRPRGRTNGVLFNNVTGNAAEITFGSDNEFKRQVLEHLAEADKTTRVIGEGDVVCDKCMHSHTYNGGSCRVIGLSKVPCMDCGGRSYTEGNLLFE